MRRFEAFILIRAGNSFDPRLVLISRKRHPLSPTICVYLHAKGRDEQEKAKEVDSDKSPIAHGSRSLGRRTRRRAMLDLALHELASEKAMEVANYFLFQAILECPSAECSQFRTSPPRPKVDNFLSPRMTHP
jgi:hypothetical protein